MLIWILAIVLLLVVAVVGYYQGAIKAACSLIGLFLAASLAMPLAGLGRGILGIFGLSNPFLLQVLGPVLVFLILLVASKLVAFNIDRKYDYIYKYQKGDYDRLKFDRMSARVGFCVGLFNGAVYFLILLIPFYVFGYLTVQVAGADQEGGLKFFNTVRQAITSSKLDRVIQGMDPAPKEFYVASDVVGLVRQNPVLQARLSQYPSIVTLTERQEFQDLTQDPEVARLVERQAPLTEILEHPKVKVILNSKEIWDETKKLGSDLNDLKTYLETGASAKYADSPFLGRWVLEIEQTLIYSRRKRPAMSGMEYNQIRNVLMTAMQSGILSVTSDGKIVLRSRGTGAPEELVRVVFDGTWQKSGNGASGSISQNSKTESVEITMDSPNRLLLQRGGTIMVFDRPM
jgi:hypothetical protein